MEFWTGTANRRYQQSDCKYDIDRGYLEYASLGYEAKIESRTTVNSELHASAHAEMMLTHDTAMICPSGGEPLTRAEMLLRHDAHEWKKAEQEELASLRKLHCWTPVPRSSATKKVLNCGYVYKQKPAAPPLPARKKARLVIKGWNEDVANLETFAPVVRFETVRTALAHAAHDDLEIWSADIMSAYILSPLQPGQDVWMNDPEDPKGDTVFKLNRALYGLKSSARNWNNHFHKWLLSRGFKRSAEDHGMYTRGTGAERIVLLVFVDDTLTICNAPTLEAFKAEFKQEWEIRDYGEPKTFLGCDIERMRAEKTIRLSQETYITGIAERLGITRTHTVGTPFEPNQVLTSNDDEPDVNSTEYRAIVGMLMFCVTMTQPLCAFHVKELSRHLAHPKQVHMDAALRVARHLYHHRHLGIIFNRSSDGLWGFSDSNFCNCVDTRRSTGGHIFTLYGSPISWASKLQPTISHSTAEAEVRALSECAREAKWLRRLVADVTGKSLTMDSPTRLHCDNRAAEMWSRNPHHHARQKHIDRCDLSIREEVLEYKTVSVRLVPTQDQWADGFTKALPLPAFRINVGRLMG